MLEWRNSEDGTGFSPLHEDRCNQGFSERRAVIFHSSLHDSCDLRIDDEPLTREATPSGSWTWRWLPGFYAGEVRAELLDGSHGLLGAWRLDVSPDASKLGSDLFGIMLDELLAANPALVVGREPARRPFGALGDNEEPLVAMVRLRVREKQLTQALAQIEQHPLRVLRPQREIVPFRLVRRVDCRTVRRALATPVLGATLAKSNKLQLAMSNHLLDVPVVERTMDSAATRAVLARLKMLRFRCMNILVRLEESAGAELERQQTRTSYGKRLPVWKEFLQSLCWQLTEVMRRTPFCEAKRGEISSAGLSAVAAHPVYARFWRLSAEALNTGVAGQTRMDQLPLSPTWEIYERWCFLELCRILKLTIREAEWNKDGHKCLVGKTTDGLCIELRLQPVFHGCEARSGKFWSVSRQREPDIVLAWKRGDDSGFVIFDAKYRASRRNVLDAMTTAHVYQDSLRMGNQRPKASVLLVPAGGGAPSLEKEECVQQHRVGVAPLRPSLNPPEWLNSLLSPDSGLLQQL